MNTRLSKLDALDSEYSALILAHAGLHRLGWTNRISQVLDTPIMYYAVGQGALAVECRQDDTRILKLLEPLKDYTTTITCSAERALMKRLEGGCSVPLGVSTKFDGRTLELSCIVCSLDGKIEIIESMNANVCSESEQDQKKDQSYESAMLLGVALADKMIQLGAKTLLDKIRIENNQTLK